MTSQKLPHYAFVSVKCYFTSSVLWPALVNKTAHGSETVLQRPLHGQNCAPFRKECTVKRDTQNQKMGRQNWIQMETRELNHQSRAEEELKSQERRTLAGPRTPSVQTTSISGKILLESIPLVFSPHFHLLRNCSNPLASTHTSIFTDVFLGKVHISFRRILISRFSCDSGCCA